MKKSDAIPDQVKQFILTMIDSVPHLEALLLIWEHQENTWTDDGLDKALFVDTRVAKKIANDLLRRGWIVRKSGAQDEFTYDGSWDPDDQLLKQIAETYRNNIVRIATLIHANASGVRDFAKAFELKSD